MPLRPGADKTADINNFTIVEQQMLVMAVTGITRNGSNRPTQVIRGGTTADGTAVTVTTNFTYDGAGRIATGAHTFAGLGPSVTKTETITRDGNGRFASSAVT
jgi:hypothetical protein